MVPMLSPRLPALMIASLITAMAFAQLYPITITTQVNPPYSANYVDYFLDGQQVAISFLSTDLTTRQIYLAGSISTTTGDIEVSVEGGSPWNAPPLDVGYGFSSITGGGLEPFIQGGGGQVQYIGISEEDLRDGMLPEGEYRLCLRAYDYYTNELLSGPDPLGCSNVFTIREAEPPLPISPSCGEMVSVSTPQLVIFNWQLPAGPPPGSILEYNFRLVRTWDATNAQSALETSTDLVHEATTMSPVLVYTQAMPALDPGQLYAWWVQVVDLNNNTVFRRGGYMEPCTFIYQSHNDGEFELVYPVYGDTLPWDLIPIMVRFEPHLPPDQTGRFHSKLTIGRDGLPFDETERKPGNADILWNSGPFESQRHLLNLAGAVSNPPFDAEQAHHINIHRNDVLRADRFLHGHTYTLDAALRINIYAETNAIYGDVSGTLVSGMGRPRPLHPLHEAVIQANGGDTTVSGFAPVELRFRTAEAPARLLPPFPIWIIPEEGPPTQTQAYIDEKWVLDVSRQPTFEETVYITTKVVGDMAMLNDPGCDITCLENALYKEETVTFTPGDTGIYYWRVRWLMDTDDVGGSTYHEGPVRSFRIVDGEPVSTPPGEEVRPAECLAESRFPRVPAAQQVPANNTAVGDTVQVGLFSMIISQITWAGGSATGEGTIAVPFMNCPLRVNFNGIRINETKRMFDGVVKGRYDNSGIVPSSLMQSGSMLIGFSPEAAQDIDDYVNTNGRLVAQMTMSNPMGLPIGIAREVPGGHFTVGIVGMHFTDTLATLNAVMSVPFPELDFNAGLGGMDIPFHPDGVGNVNEQATLYLADDIRVNIASDSLVLRGTRFSAGYQAVVDSGTFVAWDCKGFRALTIDAQYRFSREHLREDLPNGNSGPDKIVASMKVRTGRGGLMGRVDFNKPFHIDGVEGWGFAVQEAWMDMASYANPPEMTLSPEVAERVGLVDDQGTNQDTWRGFYLKRAMLRLPNEVERFGSTERVTGLVDDLVITSSGVTASFKLINLIGESEGELDGWAISVDTLQMDIVANSFHQAGLKGRLRTSVSPTLLDYSALLRQNAAGDDRWLEFLVQSQDDLSVPFLFGSIDLEETSTVVATLGHAQLGSYAKATLNGTLDLSTPPDAAIAMSFTGIEFENLWFGTRAPYTNIDSSAVFSLASPQKYMGGDLLDDDTPPPAAGGTGGGFPVSITEVTGERTTIDGKPAAGLAYDINLNLTGTSNIFVATTRVATLGVLNTTEIHQWGDHEMRLDSIGVTGETGAVNVNGGLKWYRDSPTFGNGIKGNLRAEFMNRKVQVEAAAQFGSISGYKYWYVDAMVAKKPGWNWPAPITIYGFGGAAWYHMQKHNGLPQAADITVDQILVEVDPTLQPGYTYSGLDFTPDQSVGFGLQATVVFSDPGTTSTYNGNVSLGAQFNNTTGGLLEMFLEGDLYVMKMVDHVGHVPIRGNGRISYDFPNDVFTAGFEMFVDVGPGKVYGLGPQNRAGQLELFVNPDNWHLYIGNPDDRVQLTVAGLTSGGFYFMVGDDLPQVPMPPPEVAQHVPPGYLVRDDLSDAGGLAFGANFHFSHADTVLIFFYSLNGEAGFDITFRDATEMECLGEADPGIGPFYARGQLYAHMSAAVGIILDAGFFSGSYHLFDIGLAGLFQCGFANPSWLKGFVYGEYDILHGMVQGSINLPFQAGDQCEPPNSGLLDGLDPIGDLSPPDLSGLPPSCDDAKLCGVDCGTMPEAVFNMKVDQSFTMHEMRSNGSWVARTFKLEIEHFELRKKTGNTLVAATNTIATNKEMATLGPDAYLEPNTEFTVSIKLRALELKDSGWEEVKKENVPVTWMRKHTFKTNTGIEELSPGDVAWSYPFFRQRFLLQDECRNGVIDCKSSLVGQPVIEAPPGRKREYRVVFVPLNGGAMVERDADMTTTDSTTALTFDIPPLQNSRTYTLKVVARDVIDASTMGISGDGPAPSGGFNPQDHAQGLLNTQVQNTGIAVVGSSTTTSHQGMVNIRRQSLQGYTLRADEKLIYEYPFRTSQHNTLSAKAAALANSGTNYLTTTHVPARETLEPAFTGEGFDSFDAKGYPYSRNTGNDTIPPMVFLTAANTDNWMANWAKPVLYDYYGLIKSSGCSDLQIARTTNIIGSGPFAISVIRDTPDNIGIPPYRTVRFHPNALIWNPLSDSESAPSISYGVPGVASGINSMGDGSSGNQTILQVSTGVWTRNDYIRLKTITDDVILNCGPLNPVIDGQGEAMSGIGEPLRSKVLAFQNGYRRMYKGNYCTTMRFIPPPTCPFSYVEQGDADNAPGSMGDAVYSHPLGATPPTPGANPVPGGGGIIQN